MIGLKICDSRAETFTLAQPPLAHLQSFEQQESEVFFASGFSDSAFVLP